MLNSNVKTISQSLINVTDTTNTVKLKNTTCIVLITGLTTTSENIAENTIDLRNHDFPDTGFLANMTLRHDGNYLDLTATSVGYNVVGKTLHLYAFNKNNDWDIGLSSSASVVIFTVQNG